MAPVPYSISTKFATKIGSSLFSMNGCIALRFVLKPFFSAVSMAASLVLSLLHS